MTVTLERPAARSKRSCPRQSTDKVDDSAGTDIGFNLKNRMHLSLMAFKASHNYNSDSKD